VITDFRLALSFLTRWPVSLPETLADGAMARCMWAFPLVGGLIGAIIAALYLLAGHLWPAWPCAFIALAAGMMLTFALHEDGLADCADGFGGGRDKDRIIAIMRDSRIGAYGTLALIVSVLLKASIIVSFVNPAAPLIIAHMMSRAALPVVMTLMPPASSGGLAAGFGTLPRWTAIIAVILALAVPCWLIPYRAAVCVIAAVLAGGAVALLARRKIGGYSGDVLGAIQQCVELAVLLAILARP